MRNYSVTEQASGRTEVIKAISKDVAIQIAKLNYKMPMFGFYTVIELTF